MHRPCKLHTVRHQTQALNPGPSCCVRTSLTLHDIQMCQICVCSRTQDSLHFFPCFPVFYQNYLSAALLTTGQSANHKRRSSGNYTLNNIGNTSHPEQKVADSNSAFRWPITHLWAQQAVWLSDAADNSERRKAWKAVWQRNAALLRRKAFQALKRFKAYRFGLISVDHSEVRQQGSHLCFINLRWSISPLWF